MPVHWQARNSTTRPPEIGHRPAASMLPACAIPQHCFPMGRCWSQAAWMAGISGPHLYWRGATSATVENYRNGNVTATTPNDGSYDETTGTTGQASFMYQVCDAGTQNCSNTVTVNFGP